jgi:hypothetical protein
MHLIAATVSKKRKSRVRMALIGYVGASFGKKGLGLLGLPVSVGIQP